MYEQRISKFRAASRFCGLGVAVLGLAVLAGWALDWPLLTSVLPGLATMKVNTAFGFFLAGVSLLMADQAAGQAAPARRSARFVAALVVLLLGLLTGGEYVFDVDLGIDQLLVRMPPVTDSAAPPGRMAVATAVGFILTGLALLLLHGRRGWGTAQGIVLIANLIGMLALLGYLYDVDMLDDIFPYTSVALHTAVGFITITSGVLLARPDVGFMSLVVSETTGGVMARRLLPLALLAPLLIGWFRIRGEQLEFFSSAFGVALVALTYMTLFSAFILRTAHVLRDSDRRRAEAERGQTQQKTQLQGIVDTAMDVIITVDAEAHITLFNPAAEKIFGYPADQVLGNPLEMLLPARFRSMHRAHFESFCATGTTSRRMGGLGAIMGLRANGEEFPAEASISKLLVDGKATCMVILRDVSESYKAQAEIREKETLFRLFIEHVPVALAMFDREMRYLAVSKRWMADYGLGDRDVIGLSQYEVFPEISEYWKDVHRRGLTGEVINADEDRFERADGSVQWLRWEVLPWSRNDGEVSGILIFAEEITARKQAEQARLETEALSRATLQAMPAHIAVLDRQGRIISVNQAWSSFAEDNGAGNRFGVTEGANYLAVCRQAVTTDVADAAQTLAGIEGVLDGSLSQYSQEYPCHGPREQRWFLMTVVPMGIAGRSGGAVITHLDISKLKLAEEKLRIIQQDLQRAQSVGVIGSWRLDVRRNELTWSEENYRIFGVPDDKVLTYEDFIGCVHPDDRAYVDCEWQLALRGEHYDIEHRLIVNGTVKWVRERAELEFDANGILLGGFGTTQDVTDRRQVEEELRLAKQAAESVAEAKSNFLAIMSHEIRTPLHVIIGLGHLLRRDIANPRHLQRLNELCASSDHLLAILNDILDLSKIEAEQATLESTAFRLGNVIARVEHMVIAGAQEKGLALVVDVAPSLQATWVRGDPVRLAQVLINLCCNAVKFADQGTVRLALTCENSAAASVTLGFVITDTGCGISPADQARLFQPFSQIDTTLTRARGGTGLGLAISQRLVKLMGGEIRVTSREGTGSTFSFTLVMPRVEAGAPEAPAVVPGLEATHFHGKRVLLVDDHPQSQDIMLEMLEDLGCEVDIAGNGVEAVECARTHAYDLILTDMQMPRMDGLTATGIIRKLPGYRDIPIIALTANAFIDDRRRCLAAGMNGHLGKPVTPSGLLAMLSQWLPGLVVPGEAPPCDNELSRALLQIPGLEVGASWRRSPEHLAAFVTQLERFIKNHDQDMIRLRVYLASAELAAARGIAHDLKGIAGLIGVQCIAALASEIEERLLVAEGRDGERDVSGVTELADACETELVRLAGAVRSLPVLPAAPASP